MEDFRTKALQLSFISNDALVKEKKFAEQSNMNVQDELKREEEYISELRRKGVSSPNIDLTVYTRKLGAIGWYLGQVLSEMNLRGIKDGVEVYRRKLRLVPARLAIVECSRKEKEDDIPTMKCLTREDIPF